MILVSQSWKSQPYYFQLLKMVIEKLLLITERRNILKDSLGERTGISIGYHTVRDVENFKKSLALLGTSASAFRHIAGVRWQPFAATYESIWSMWFDWCSRKQINSLTYFIAACKIRV